MAQDHSSLDLPTSGPRIHPPYFTLLSRTAHDLRSSPGVLSHLPSCNFIFSSYVSMTLHMFLFTPQMSSSLLVSLGTSYLYLKTLLGYCLFHEAFPDTSHPILQSAKCFALQYPFSSLSNLNYFPENGILD